MKTINIEFTKEELEKEILIHGNGTHASCKKYLEAIEKLNAPNIGDRVGGYIKNTDRRGYIIGIYESHTCDNNHLIRLDDVNVIKVAHCAKIKKEAEF